MKNDHGITDELREWAKKLAHWWYGPVKNEYIYTTSTMSPSIDAIRLDSNITAIADRIDAALAERYIELPKDAHGVPIRVGDKVDSDHHEDGTVTGVQFYEMANGGIRTLVAVRPDGWDVATWRDPEEYAHHHAPTVEDVLRELLDAWDGRGDTGGIDLSEFAAKLRLAGDAE